MHFVVAGEVDADCVVLESLRAEAADDFAGELRANCALDVGDRAVKDESRDRRTGERRDELVAVVVVEDVGVGAGREARRVAGLPPAEAYRS